MVSSSSGMFPSYSQTGPTDQSGSGWDMTTVEGAQNFPAFADQGDSVDYMDTGRDQMDAVDDFQSTWAAEPKMHKSEPMRRISSKGSVGSNKNRTIKAPSKSSKIRPRLQTALSQASHVSKYEVTGNDASAFQEGVVSSGRIMDVHQYLSQEADALSASSPPMYGPTFFPGLMGLPADGLPYNDMTMSQHVDPTCTQVRMDYESLSPPWDAYSATGSPRCLHDDVWPPVTLPESPPDSQTSSSPSFDGHSPRNHIMADEDISMTSLEDQFSLPPAWSTRRSSHEGESARDHPLYKNAFPHADGLFHCPWEGQPTCNHRPEKLKCNYDKFVDSHLKPYRCKVESCENARFSSTACLLRHEREAHAMHGHGEKPYSCIYEGCERALPGNGFPRQWNLKDHMRRVHNDNGSAPAPNNPTAVTVPLGPQKERKRKGESTGSGRRKSSHRAAAAAAAAAAVDASHNNSNNHKVVDPVVKQHANFEEYKRALADLVQGLAPADSPLVFQQFKEAKEHLDAMNRISKGLMSQQNANMMHSHRRSG
ncbi:Zinc finger protein ZIC 5 [Pleurostoma richardsiae]|uniref:Zinc finger protein ZIC 5 n=1 Tax=Pleurostoma richardsiae TaxID=41990 RepID=A0AA38RQP5_9PEZI|nr:Zinc finger protein ZIC 5 [Pleurostoma richardsiae]